MKSPVQAYSRFWIYAAGVLTLSVSACAPEVPPVPQSALPSSAAPQEALQAEDQTAARSGGRATVFDAGQEAFSHRIPNPDLQHRTQFFTGESLFDQNWVAAPASTVARDGLGPVFNARSCAACHGKDGRSNPFLSESEADQALLVRLSADTSNPQQDQQPHAYFGGQLQPFALPRLAGEGTLRMSWLPQQGTYADGETYTLMRPEFQVEFATAESVPSALFSVRQSPQLVGLGLLEAIQEADILKHSDPDDQDGDGISGRPNQVWDIATQRTVQGRFGWKANQPNVQQQVAGAFHGDLGITTSLFPVEDITPWQEAQQTKDFGGSVPNGKDGDISELPDRLLERVTFYIQNLAVPARRRVSAPNVQQGERVFAQLKCQACHVSSYRIQTDQGPDTIMPYTDLLLHDMGPDLADGRPDFLASGQEWRTPPLWGIGLIKTVNGHTRFLHDGRARNLTEAVLWHGGEARASQQAFTRLSKTERQALIAFLESL